MAPLFPGGFCLDLGMTDFDLTQRRFLADLINKTAILRKEQQTILSASGEKLDWLIDMRRIFLNADALDVIAGLFWDHYGRSGPIQVAGMEVASVPLVAALILKAKERGISTNGLLIRKERKTTGTGQIIEGVPNENPVVLVDDIVNSGNSLDKAFAALRQSILDIHEVFVVIDYNSEAGLDWRKKKNVNVTSLFDLAEFGLAVKSPPPLPVSDYAIAWRYYSPGAFPFHTVPKSTPLLVGDKIYMGLEKGAMVCVDAKTGKAVWEFPIAMDHNKGVWSSPAHHAGRIYFGAYNGCVYCLDAKTGAVIWANPCCDWVGSSPLIVEKHNMLYLGLEYQRHRAMGSNAALDLDTGSRLWEIPQKKYQHGSAAYFEPIDAVIFGNADHNLSAYEAKTGKLIWQSDTERSLKYPPAIDVQRGRVIGTSFDGKIYVVDAVNGRKLAAFHTNDLCYTTPLIYKNKIFAGSGDKHMYIIDADTLQMLKRMDCGSRVYSSPRVINGRVVFGTNGGRIIELDGDTLEVLAVSQLPDAIPNAIASTPDGSMMFAATHMNEIYAIQCK